MPGPLGVSWRQWGFGAAVVSVFALIKLWPSSPSASHAQTTIAPSAPSASAIAMERATPVTAAKLFADYHDNEVRADDAYKGKRLAVSGTVARVRKDFTDSVIVELTSANTFEPVTAHIIDEERANAGALSKGANVTVECVGDGMVIGMPMLRECRVR